MGAEPPLELEPLLGFSVVLLPPLSGCATALTDDDEDEEEGNTTRISFVGLGFERFRPPAAVAIAALNVALVPPAANGPSL